MSIVWGWSLPAAEKLVALKLADCANDAGGNSYPALATIATDCGLARRTVQDILVRLVRKGGIEVQTGHTSRRPTTYRVCLTAPLGGAAAAPLEVQEDHPRGAAAAPQGCSRITPGVQEDHPRGAAGSPLEVQQDHPIRQITITDPSYTRPARARARTRDGRRPHPLDEAPCALEPWAVEAFEQLYAIYPRKDARVAALCAWQTLNPSQELAAFIHAHVQTRLTLGWARDIQTRFLPLLRTFLEERRWMEQYAPPPTSKPGGDLPEGLLVVRTCPRCGAGVEGRVMDGRRVFPACSCEERPQ